MRVEEGGPWCAGIVVEQEVPGKTRFTTEIMVEIPFPRGSEPEEKRPIQLWDVKSRQESSLQALRALDAVEVSPTRRSAGAEARMERRTRLNGEIDPFAIPAPFGRKIGPAEDRPSFWEPLVSEVLWPEAREGHRLVSVWDCAAIYPLAPHMRVKLFNWSHWETASITLTEREEVKVSVDDITMDADKVHAFGTVAPEEHRVQQNNIEERLPPAPERLWAAIGGPNASRAVPALLEERADPNAGSSSCTALHVAAGVGHVEVLELLIAAKGDMDQRTYSNGRDGWSPLAVAIDRGHMACVRLLLEAKARTDGPTLILAAPREPLEVRHLDEAVAGQFPASPSS